MKIGHKLEFRTVKECLQKHQGFCGKNEHPRHIFVLGKTYL